MYSTTATRIFPGLLPIPNTLVTSAFTTTYITATVTETQTVTQMIDDAVQTAIKGAADVAMTDVPSTCAVPSFQTLAPMVINNTISNLSIPLKTAANVASTTVQARLGVDVTSLAMGAGLGAAGLAFAHRSYQRYCAPEPRDDASSWKTKARFLSFIARKLAQNCKEKDEELALSHEQEEKLQKGINDEVLRREKAEARLRNLQK